MAKKVGEIYVDVKARTDKVNGKLKQLENSVNKRSTRMSSAGSKAFTKIGDVALNVFAKIGRVAKNVIIGTVVGAFAAMSAAIVKSVTTSAKFEKLQLRLEQVLGSAEAATIAFKELVAFSAKTPFQLDEIIGAASALEAFGASSKKLIKPIGDLAVFMGVDIVEAANAFGRAFAGGAGAADILRERGILNLIKMKSGINDLTKLTLPDFRRAMIDTMTDPSGRVAGGTAKLAKTISGKWSTLKDNIVLIFKGFGDQINKTFVGQGLDKVLKALTDFAEYGWGPTTKAMLDTWQDMLDVMVRITVLAFKNLGDVIQPIPQGMGFAASLKKNKGNIVKSVADVWAASFKVSFANASEDIQPIIDAYAKKIKDRAKAISDSMPDLIAGGAGGAGRNSEKGLTKSGTPILGFGAIDREKAAREEQQRKQLLSEAEGAGFLDPLKQKGEFQEIASKEAEFFESVFSSAGRSFISDLDEGFGEAIKSWGASFAQSMLQAGNDALAKIAVKSFVSAVANIIAPGSGAVAASLVGHDGGSFYGGKKFAAGGSMTVPGGFNNDSYPIRVESRELVNVYTPSQQADLLKTNKGIMDSVQALSQNMVEIQSRQTAMDVRIYGTLQGDDIYLANKSRTRYMSRVGG